MRVSSFACLIFAIPGAVAFGLAPCMSHLHETALASATRSAAPLRRRSGGGRMKVRVGIIGLPNVGKSRLFNALARKSLAQAANFPFCTIEPNVARIAVPDAQLGEQLQARLQPYVSRQPCVARLQPPLLVSTGAPDVRSGRAAAGSDDCTPRLLPSPWGSSRACGAVRAVWPRRWSRSSPSTRQRHSVGALLVLGEARVHHVSHRTAREGSSLTF